MEELEPKVRAIRDYLVAEFRESKVEAFQDGGPSGPFVFRIDHGLRGAALHRVVASSTVLGSFTATQLLDVLSRWDLAARLREAGLRPVVVTRDGLQVEGQLPRQMPQPVNPSR